MDILLCVLFSMRILCYTITAEIGTERRRARGDVYKRQPILQDGRLVGAVTHVLVNDPTRGYGIFAENMVQSADAAAQREAA